MSFECHDVSIPAVETELQQLAAQPGNDTLTMWKRAMRIMQDTLKMEAERESAIDKETGTSPETL